MEDKGLEVTEEMKQLMIDWKIYIECRDVWYDEFRSVVQIC